MPICEKCQSQVNEPVIETEPIVEKRRGRPVTVTDRVAQKKLYNNRYYVRCKERRSKSTEENKESDIKTSD
jgi:hypothetical protein